MAFDTADLIFVNGKVLTMVSDEPANAVAVKGGRIVCVGDQAVVTPYKTRSTELIDLHGQTLMPGFIDSHMHPTHYAKNLLGVDCRPSRAPSIAAIQSALAVTAQNTPLGSWIQGWGWDDSKLDEGRTINRWDLDQVVPDHPVILRRTCSHMLVANTHALRISGIDLETPDPQGGHIERSADTGEPTGLLQEKAQGLVNPPPYSQAEVLTAMGPVQEDLARWGITTVHDMATQVSDLRLYQSLHRDDALGVRVRPWLWALDQIGFTGMLEEVVKVGIESGFGNEFVKIQGMKFMLDGGIGGRTAAVACPYDFGGGTGLLFDDGQGITPLVRKALLAGLRVGIHGIGERAIEVALNAIEAAGDAVDVKAMRNRIEHCALPTEEQLRRMSRLNIIAASSIGFLYHLGDSYLKNLGADRVARVYPQKSFQRHGIVAPGNSDLPVTDGNPLSGIYSAVTRKSESGTILDSLQNITVGEALKIYTTDAAYSSFEENTLGVIKPGANADMIVLSEDPLTIDPEGLKDIRVRATFLNGRQVYST